MLLVLLLSFFQWSQAQVPSTSVPKEHVLFFMQKEADTNAVVYLLNFNRQGKLDQKKPIKCLWIKDAANGKSPAFYRNPDPAIYGLQCKPIGDDTFEIKLNASNKISMQLKRSPDRSRYQIYINDENSDYLLKRIYMRVAKGNRRSLGVQHLDLVTVNSLSGIEFLKRINI